MPHITTEGTDDVSHTHRTSMAEALSWTKRRSNRNLMVHGADWIARPVGLLCCPAQPVSQQLQGERQ